MAKSITDTSGGRDSLAVLLEAAKNASPEEKRSLAHAFGFTSAIRKRSGPNVSGARDFVRTHGDVTRDDPNFLPVPSCAIAALGAEAVAVASRKWLEGTTLTTGQLERMQHAGEALAAQARYEFSVPNEA